MRDCILKRERPWSGAERSDKYSDERRGREEMVKFFPIPADPCAIDTSWCVRARARFVSSNVFEDSSSTQPAVYTYAEKNVSTYLEQRSFCILKQSGNF